MTRRQRELARRALGLPNSKGRSYRNYYLAAYEPGVFDEWQQMVDAGHADGIPDYGGNYWWFWLTRAGADAALEPGESLCPEDFPRSAT